MKYDRFERLVLLIGLLVVLGGLPLTLLGGSLDLIEAAAQLLMFGVLFAAVRFGRRGGLAAAMIAVGAYLTMRLPLFVVMPMPVAAVMLVASRVVGFGLMGIVGGEVCSRLKYSMTRLQGGSAIDEWSRVYNQRYLHTALLQAQARFERYGEAFSAVVVTLSPSVMTGVTPARQRTMVRGIADHLRGDVRMVDEVGRLDDGRFLVMLPHTGAEGGSIVRARLAAGVSAALGTRAESVTVKLLSAPADSEAIAGLLGEIEPPDAGDQEPAESTEYSSSSAITRNPA